MELLALLLLPEFLSGVHSGWLVLLVPARHGVEVNDSVLSDVALVFKLLGQQLPVHFVRLLLHLGCSAVKELGFFSTALPREVRNAGLEVDLGVVPVRLVDRHWLQSAPVPVLF